MPHQANSSSTINDLPTLFKQALNTLRQRYQPTTAYRYTPAVYLFIALAISVIQANDTILLLGAATPAIITLGIIAGLANWLILAYSMSKVFTYFGIKPISLYGYTLATKALVLPNLLLFYFPNLASLLMFWNIWAFWTQMVGFKVLSEQERIKPIVYGYLLYLIYSIAILFLCTLFFHTIGWLDLQHFTNIFTTQENQP